MTKLDEGTLTKAILKRWPLGNPRPRYVTAVQVNNYAGFGYSRTIDAIVFDTWPGPGLHLHGLEIKTTKADLRRELQNTKKFHDFANHLDLFSIVAPKGIVDLKLLPPKWGLYILTDDDNLRARRKPLMLHDEGGRKTINRSFAAAFVRALITRSLSHEATAAAYSQGREDGEQSADYDKNVALDKLEKIQTSIDDFEKSSGIKITNWQAGQMGEAVNLIIKGGIKSRIRYAPDVRKLGEHLIKLADELDELVEVYENPPSRSTP